MNTITMLCEGCSKTYTLNKTPEIPAHVWKMRCNWCPSCEDSASDYYEEWYDEDESGETPEPEPDNQLCMPFVLEEISPEKVEVLSE